MSQQGCRGLKIRHACLIFFMSLLLHAAFAADVYIVASSDAAPYESCSEALQKKLEKAGHTVHASQLKDFGEKQQKNALADARFISTATRALAPRSGFVKSNSIACSNGALNG